MLISVDSKSLVSEATVLAGLGRYGEEATGWADNFGRAPRKAGSEGLVGSTGRAAGRRATGGIGLRSEVAEEGGDEGESWWWWYWWSGEEGGN